MDNFERNIYIVNIFEEDNFKGNNFINMNFEGHQPIFFSVLTFLTISDFSGGAKDGRKGRTDSSRLLLALMPDPEGSVEVISHPKKKLPISFYYYK